MIPFVDLQSNFEGIQDEINQEVSEVYRSGAFILGPAVRQFENRFARYIGTAFGIGVATGTDALIIACKALDIGEGDEVLVPANTFIASAIAVCAVGAKPVPVDINSSNFLLDLNHAEHLTNTRTKAIMPVHLYGQILDMSAVLDFAKSYGLKVIEDAAQAHGAELGGRKAGSFGDIGCFSFYPSKNLGAAGDGGCLVTNDPEIDRRARSLRNYGSTEKYRHEILGTNSRLDSVHAAVLNVKLKRLDHWNANRFVAACQYDDALRGVAGIIPPQFDRNHPGRHVFHLYVVRCMDRVGAMNSLEAGNIQFGIHYPSPFYLQPAFRPFNFKAGQCKIAETVAQEILSLPMYPEITQEQVTRVVDALSPK